TWKLARIVSHRNLFDLGSIPVLGSSIRITLGPLTIAIAKLSFLLVPPEHSWLCLSACSKLDCHMKKEILNYNATMNIERRSERPRAFEDEELQTLVDENPCQTQKQLAEALNYTQSVIV
ncbi:hypothetical protein ALC57_03039, partial [Trachymyrmex cornetzi]